MGDDPIADYARPRMEAAIASRFDEMTIASPSAEPSGVVQYAYSFPAIDGRGAFSVVTMARADMPVAALDREIRDALTNAGYPPPLRLPHPERRDVPQWELDLGRDP